MKALSVNELREQVAAKVSLSTEELNKLTKPQLKKMLKDITEVSEVLDGVEIVKPEDIKLEAVSHTLPTNPEWSDYVLSQLTDNEKDNGSPRVDGLRRIATKLLGPFSSHTEVVQAPGLDGRATVMVRLEFA